MKPASGAPRVALVGTFQVGKSTLINCLLARNVADMGEGLPTTHVIATYRFASTEVVHLYPDGSDRALKMEMPKYRQAHADRTDDFSNLARVEFDLDRERLREVEMVDTPGLDASGGQGSRDTRMTEQVLGEADLFVFVTSNRQLSEPEVRLARQIADTRKPFVVVMNCMSERRHYNAEVNGKTAAAIAASLDSAGLKPFCVNEEAVWRCNVLWYWCARMKCAGQEMTDPNLTTKLEEGWADIEYEFRKQHNATPSPEQVIAASNVPGLISFLTGDDPFRIRTARNVVRLHQAAEEWRQAVLKAVQDTKSVLASP